MILLPKYRTSQPQGISEINWGNPITRGLVAAYLPNARFPAKELVTSATDSASTRLSVGPGTRGVKGFNTGASTAWSLNFGWATRWPHPYGLANYPAVSVFTLFEQYDTTTIGAIFGGGNNATNYARFVKNNDGSISFAPNTNTGGTNINGPVLDTDRVYALAGINQGNYRELFVDAVSVASANTALTFTNSAFTYAGSSYITSQFRRIGLYCGYVWTRRLLDSEIKSLTDNPWQIFLNTSPSGLSIEYPVWPTGPNTLPGIYFRRLPTQGQPQPVASINNGNLLSRGIVGWQTGVDLNKFSNGNATYPVNPPIPSLQGLARTYNIPAPATSTTAGPHLVGSLSSTVGTTTTIVSLCRPNSSEMESLRSTYGAIVHGTASIYASAGFSAYYLYFYYFGSSWTVDFSTQTVSGSRTAFGNITLDSNWHVLVGRQSSATSRDVWFDGRQIASDTVSSSPASINTATIGNNTVFTGGAIGQFVGDIALTIVYNRALSNSEIVQLSRNPWQIFNSTRNPLNIFSIEYYAPYGDIQTTGWTATPSYPPYYDKINEATPDDAEFITSPDLSGTPGAYITSLDAPLLPGSYTINFRADWDTSAGQVRVSLLDNDNNVIGQSGWISVTSSYADYAYGFTIGSTAYRVKVEVQP